MRILSIFNVNVIFDLGRELSAKYSRHPEYMEESKFLAFLLLVKTSQSQQNSNLYISSFHLKFIGRQKSNLIWHEQCSEFYLDLSVHFYEDLSAQPLYYIWLIYEPYCRENEETKNWIVRNLAQKSFKIWRYGSSWSYYHTFTYFGSKSWEKSFFYNNKLQVDGV